MISMFVFALLQLPAPETASPIEDASTPTKQAKNCPMGTDRLVKNALKFNFNRTHTHTHIYTKAHLNVNNAVFTIT